MIFFFYFFQMIETGCFKELNALGPNSWPPDLLINHPTPNNENKGCFPFRRKVILLILNFKI